MKCPKCGAEVRDGAKYCGSCGGKMPSRSVGGTLLAVMKILACVLIMTLCQACVMTVYEANVIVNDKDFVNGIQSVVTETTEEEGGPGYTASDSFTDYVMKVSASLLEEIMKHLSSITLLGNLITVLVILLGLRIRKHEPLKSLRFRMCNPGRLVTFLLFGAALNIIVSCVISMIPWPAEIIETFSDQYSGFYLGGDSVFVQVLSVGIATPILEEMIFRAFAMTHLKPAAGKSAAIVISAVIFALAHYAFTPGSFIAVGYAFLIGLLFAAMFDKYDSIIPSVLCHMGFNLITFVKFNDEGTVPAYVIAIAVFASVFCAYRIFFRYPTFSDVLFDTAHIKPINGEEERIVSRISEIKNGEEEPDREEIEALEREWIMNRQEERARIKLKTDDPHGTCSENGEKDDNNDKSNGNGTEE